MELEKEKLFELNEKLIMENKKLQKENLELKVNKTTITFELKNDSRYMTYLRNSAITMLKFIVDENLSEFDLREEKYDEVYNKSIDDLIKILELMKVEVIKWKDILK